MNQKIKYKIILNKKWKLCNGKQNKILKMKK